MRIITHLTSLVSFVFLLNMPVLAETNLSMQELRDQYVMYDKIANDPDIFWFRSYSDEAQRMLYIAKDIDIALGKFIHRAEFEKIMMRMFKGEGTVTLEERTDFMVDSIRASQIVKNKIRNNLLPNLRKTIKERENSSNSNTNLNDNTSHQSDTSSFDNMLEK